jgi:hypothetical protein
MAEENKGKIKDKLFLVHFMDGYIKPVIAVTPSHVRELIEEEGERKVSEIVKIEIEQNYYPQNEDFFDV